jgi:hypothetical protein
MSHPNNGWEQRLSVILLSIYSREVFFNYYFYISNLRYLALIPISGKAAWMKSWKKVDQFLLLSDGQIVVQKFEHSEAV